jgi:hypothetical protein
MKKHVRKDCDNRDGEKLLEKKMEALRRENAEGIADLQERMKDEGFRERVEALLLEGLNSPKSEMTDEDWKAIRREGIARIAAEKKRGKGRRQTGRGSSRSR